MSTNRTRQDSGKADLGLLKRGPRGFFCCRFCGKEVDPPKVTFCSSVCVHEWRLRTDPGYLRKNVFIRDKGVCAKCGRNCDKLQKELRALDNAARRERRKELNIPEGRKTFWDADHVLPVSKNGGECGIGNLQTLCWECHKQKTKEDRRMVTTNVDFQVLNGDSQEVLKTLPEGSIDALVTDPPAGISFLNRAWDDATRTEEDEDAALPPRDSFVKWLTGLMREAHRVLKPGAYGLVWALPRTAHWTTMALEDAGFDVRDVKVHVNFTGFPKSHDVSKGIDKHLGAEREKVQIPADQVRNPKSIRSGSGIEGGERPFMREAQERGYHEMDSDKAVTREAKQWEGWGTALKPASEFWVLIRKRPIGSVAENILKYGTGALNIGATRIATKDRLNGGAYSEGGRAAPLLQEASGTGFFKAGSSAGEFKAPKGRWPANFMLSHTDCKKVGTRKVKTGTAQEKPLGSDNNRQVYEGMQFQALGRDYTFGEDGYEEIDSWECAPDCPVAELDRQSGNRANGRYPGVQNALPGRGNITANSGGWSGDVPPERDMGDEGGGSRFFKVLDPEPEVSFHYEAKASMFDRNAGTEDLYWKRSPDRPSGFERVTSVEWTKLREEEKRLSKERGERVVLRARGNIHSTVKSVALMRWLTKLVTPPGGTVLDVFMGSGTTGVAAAFEGCGFVGIEQNPDYFEVAKARIDYAKVRRTVIAKLETHEETVKNAAPPVVELPKPPEPDVHGIPKEILLKAIKKGLKKRA
jgi:DNA modification methylase